MTMYSTGLPLLAWATSLLAIIGPTAGFSSVQQRVFQDAVDSRFIPWSNTENENSYSLYLVDTTVNTVPITFPVDTGSTGILLSAVTLNHTLSSLQNYRPGFEYLSSSKRYYSGYMLPSNLTFTSLGQRKFVSRVEILAVTERGSCSSFIDGNCTKTNVVHMPEGIRYMGVGFGRWSKEQPDARADRNALLNVEFDHDGIKSGYIVSQAGLVLGLTQQEVDESEGWRFTKLTKNTGAVSTEEERPEWNGTPMCVQVAGGKCFEGTALFDTGLNYSFIGVPKTATEGRTTIVDGRTVLVDGTEVTIQVGPSGNHVTGYSFEVGDLGGSQHTTPAQVRLVKQHVDGAFINTGRFFYNGFDLLFEEWSGTVGLRRKKNGLGQVINDAPQLDEGRRDTMIRPEL